MHSNWPTDSHKRYIAVTSCAAAAKLTFLRPSSAIPSVRRRSQSVPACVSLPQKVLQALRDSCCLLTDCSVRSASGDKINGNLHRHRSACVDGHGSQRVCLQSVTANTDPSLTLGSAAISNRVVVGENVQATLVLMQTTAPHRGALLWLFLCAQLSAKAAGITFIGRLFFDIVDNGHTALLQCPHCALVSSLPAQRTCSTLISLHPLLCLHLRVA